jgi:flavin-binding protein dodecin
VFPISAPNLSGNTPRSGVKWLQARNRLTGGASSAPHGACRWPVKKQGRNCALSLDGNSDPCNGVIRRTIMADSVYKVIEIIGTSPESWEQAAKNAVELAAKSLRDIRIGEVAEMDMQIEDGKVMAYRTKVKVSFKYHGE